MFYKLLNMLDEKMHFVTVAAKEKGYVSVSDDTRYDLLTMQLTALTLLRNVDLLDELYRKKNLNIEEQKQLIKLLEQKLHCNNKVKDDALMLWNYFINLPSQSDLTEAHSLLKDILINIELIIHDNDKHISLNILSTVNKITTMYWKSRGIKPGLHQCAFPLSYFISVGG